MVHYNLKEWKKLKMEMTCMSQTKEEDYFQDKTVEADVQWQ